MLVIIVIASFLLVLTSLDAGMLLTEKNMDDTNTKIIRNQVQRYGIHASAYALENPELATVFPTPANLAGRPGYEFLRFDKPTRLQAANATVNNGVWSYERSTVFFQSPSRYISNTAFLAGNTCGTGSFSSNTSWCGPHGNIWLKLESAEHIRPIMETENQRLYRVAGKFVRRFNKNSAFPPIPSPGIFELRTLVGYAGTARNCPGTPMIYQEIPLTCEDLFNAYGQPLALFKKTDRHLIFLNKTNLYKAGVTKPITLATELVLE